MQFSAFWGLNWGQESLFFIQEKVAFIQLLIYHQSHIQFLPVNEQTMKIKSCTFARKQILCKPIKKLVKIDWNMAFTWLKYNIKPVTHHNIHFHSDFMITFLFTLFKLVASSFWRKVADFMCKVADQFRWPSVLIETPVFSTTPQIPESAIGHSSSETQGQIVGARESLNGRKNIAPV